MKAKRLHWKELRSNLPIDHLVFLDESGVNLGMIRRYGRAVGGKRVVDHAPLTRPRATTLLSAIRVNKVIAQTSYLGGTTRSKFQQYVQETLLPELNPGDIVVMDNLAAHHGPGIAQMIAQAGAQILYLPPYSPDFNPIEKLMVQNESLSAQIQSLDLRGLGPCFIPGVCCRYFFRLS